VDPGGTNVQQVRSAGLYIQVQRPCGYKLFASLQSGPFGILRLGNAFSRKLAVKSSVSLRLLHFDHCSSHLSAVMFALATGHTTHHCVHITQRPVGSGGNLCWRLGDEDRGAEGVGCGKIFELKEISFGAFCLLLLRLN